MIPENLSALAKVIRTTKRFDMALIIGRYDPESDEVFVEAETPDARSMWGDETLVGDFCAWVNALSEFDKTDDEDHAASWLGLTLEQYDQLSYPNDNEETPSLWLRYKYLWNLSYDGERLVCDEITPEIAADMLDRLVKGEVIFV